MTKTAKNKEILGQLYDLVVKQASAPKPTATGVPGKEPAFEAVSEKHDHVDQNAVKPETLKPQQHEQKPSTDSAKPTGGKKAEDSTPEADAAAVTPPEKQAEAAPSVEKLGADILALVQKFASNPVATGIPSHDPKWSAVSDKHDTVDQNAVKPENLGPQSHSQKPAKDPSVPVAHAKAASDVDADKVASYELGKLWAEMVIKKAQDEQLAQVKEAGRRDFEILISNAAAQMKQAAQKQVKTASVNQVQEVEKRAEAEGAAAFHALHKQAQVEQAINQIVQENRMLAAKLAEAENQKQAVLAEAQKQLQVKEAELAQIKADEREQQKFANLAAVLEQRIFDRFSRELAPGSR